MAAGNSKSKRTKGQYASRPVGGGAKFNSGKRGGPRTRLDQGTLFLMGKGKFAKMPDGFKPGGYSGESDNGNRAKFDPVQAVKNRHAGLTGEAPFRSNWDFEQALESARLEAKRNKAAA